MTRAAALALVLAGLAAPPAGARDEHVDSPRWTSAYDEHFQKYTKRFFGPHFDWRWFKSQAIAESTLDPEARSAVGAIGVMQVMPATFEEIRRSNPHFVNVRDVRWNIAAGIWYDRTLYRHQAWEPFPDGERLLIAFASYNAGLGGALKAYRRTPPPVAAWSDMAPNAPRETQGYVARIVQLKTGAPPRHSARRRGIARQIEAAAGDGP